jgi:alpha/beta hydrolase fold
MLGARPIKELLGHDLGENRSLCTAAQASRGWRHRKIIRSGPWVSDVCGAARDSASGPKGIELVTLAAGSATRDEGFQFAPPTQYLQGSQDSREDSDVEYSTSYRSAQIDRLTIFYREAGPADAPTLLLLHGLPSSSRMFEPLFARLSDHCHLVAPDYPGFGHSEWPDPKKFAYTFDHIAEIMNCFSEALGLTRYTLYMQERRSGGISRLPNWSAAFSVPDDSPFTRA